MSLARVLITGGTGLFGTALLKRAPFGHFHILSTYLGEAVVPANLEMDGIEIDVSDHDAIYSLVQAFQPQVVIHTASIGSVDYCESHKEEAWKVNVEGTINLAKACMEVGSYFVFFSSNAVFDGTAPPYSEDSEPSPVSFYGATKKEAERALGDLGIYHCIIRLMTAYGWHNPGQRLNPVTWLLDKLNKGQSVRVVDDIYNNHLYVDAGADAIWRCIELRISGILHVAGKDVINRYQFSKLVAREFGYDPKLITPVGSNAFPGLAPRSPNTSYSTTKMVELLDMSPCGLEQGLTLMKESRPMCYKRITPLTLDAVRVDYEGAY